MGVIITERQWPLPNAATAWDLPDEVYAGPLAAITYSLAGMEGS